MPNMLDPRDQVKNDIKNRTPEERAKEQIDQMNRQQLLFDLNRKKDKDAKERKLKLKALVEKIISSLKNALSNFTNKDASDISKLGNNTAKDHGGDSTKGK